MATKVVDRYAYILFLFAKKQNQQNIVFQEMNALEESMTSLYCRFVNSQSCKEVKREVFLQKKFLELFCESTQKLINVLCQNDRIQVWSKLPKAYLQIYRQELKIKQVVVTSVSPLSKEQKQLLLEKMKVVYPKYELTLENKIDSKLLGGFQIRLENILIKVDLRSRLNQLRKHLVA